ncbi:TldD/PmbA family protein [Chitinimonas arctica]|uniref:TldD/PmbA family protein n=1 Tax=Chitinimonas arctica TaxID=2594795 RepID=A0A516SKV7_9NEIS|nr:TldD/PmbA family protein [Chitinimonas arctica]QDQ28779.1 TldD/PmbA family protein [Chitinimonas arctica]
MLETMEQRFKSLQPRLDFCALRYVEEETEILSVRQGVAEPLRRRLDRGAMITVLHQGGYGYAATSDCSTEGLRAALAHATAWAAASAGHSLFDYRRIDMPRLQGQYQGPGVGQPLDWNRKALYDLLLDESAAAKAGDARIADWSAQLSRLTVRQRYITLDGGSIEQDFQMLLPCLSVTAFADGEAQTRSLGGVHDGICRQGGMEIVAEAGLIGAGRRVSDEALALLAAPNCPSGRFDLLLMPEQMMLQIHESIGHPLELDRILGDERNYAGSSFVSLDMFGHYQYGSHLLNVTYDPGPRNEFASYGWDDEGSPAAKVWLIENGVLRRPLGGAISQARARAAGYALEGVANSRACGWNRPAIDRMANLNIEPGRHSLAQMVAGIERGVLMDTNASWSIDDTRNKFQFGCEFGRLIENGKLGPVVKNPGYRGTSATFWRSLKAVGDASTRQVMGTADCGKGEPNQAIRVGHASPACVFADVDVFGGEG